MKAFMDHQGNLTANGFANAARGLAIIQEACHLRAKSKGWWEGDLAQRNMGEMIALMHSELSEALESYRDSEPMLFYELKEAPGFVGPQRWEGPPTLGDVLGKPCGIASEFADVLIRIFDTCAALDIPLTEALLQKHAYNGTRSYRHGRKKC